VVTELFSVFEQHPALWLGVALLLGLIVGSFLNVVILRLPEMMAQDWRRECRELLSEQGDTVSTHTDADAQTVTLLRPRSRCPQCHTPIKAWQNVPIISWLLLRGRCQQCGKRISVQYPLVELSAGLLALAVAWHFEPGWYALSLWLFCWILLTSAVIDIRTQLLPDSLTLPLLWLGLVLALLLPNFPVSLEDALLGAVFGYLALWSVYWLFKLLTGKEGMGFGDFKLLAALGAWLGWQMLPIVILFSALVGSVVGIAMILLLGRDRQIPIPFGPYLAGAGLLALFWGESIMQAYLGGL